MNIFEQITYTFDPIHHAWENERTHRLVSAVLVIVFLAGLVGIELNRRGFLPPEIAAITPLNHFYAVNLAFTLVLLLEVVSLIFVLPCSMSKSVGKQFEILALILLRNSFKELVYFSEPIELANHMDAFWRLCANGTGAIAVFALLGVYYKLQPKNRGKIMSAVARYKFVASKKLVSLVLLVTFFGQGIAYVWDISNGGHGFDFFGRFYTLLVFCDILLVLISQQYLPAFHAVFRNSGYAVSTLLLRLALTAPAFYKPSIGIFAMVFAIGLTIIYNRLYLGHLDDVNGH